MLRRSLLQLTGRQPPRPGRARSPIQKFPHGFFGVLAANAVEENVYLRHGRLARRVFPKRRGFFFQGEANECGHRADSMREST